LASGKQVLEASSLRFGASWRKVVFQHNFPRKGRRFGKVGTRRRKGSRRFQGKVRTRKKKRGKKVPEGFKKAPGTSAPERGKGKEGSGRF
jgi:hypothetical protein